MDRRSFLAGLSAAPFLPAPWAMAQDLGLQGYLRTNWSQDPWSFGSYSFTPKGARQRDRRTLEAPIDNQVFFAGEAVFPFRNSTVHAAHESGLRTARMLDDRLDGNRVAIIGAGMSGLTAAHWLSEKSYDVTIFEARDRIGGRIWTSRDLGAAVDLGASWIHGPDGNPLTDLANAQNQMRVPTSESYIAVKAGKEIEDPAWLASELEIELSFGARPSEINFSSYALTEDYGGQDVVFPEGYAQIFGALVGDYDLRLQSPVSEVIQNASGVVLNGELFDAVIVTVPLGVLKAGALTFSPALPKAKQRSINRLRMGLLDKLYLKFERPFWHTDKTWISIPETGLPKGQFVQWLNFTGVNGAPILMAFNGAQTARDLAKLPDQEIVERGLTALRAGYG